MIGIYSTFVVSGINLEGDIERTKFYCEKEALAFSDEAESWLEDIQILYKR